MTLSRSYDRLVSLTISTMLTSAFLATAPDAFVSAGAGPQGAAIQNALGSAGAAGWNGIKNINLPIPPATPASATGATAHVKPITDAQFQKILADLRVNGKDHPILSEVTTLLGITHKGETLTVRQDAFRDAGQSLHTFMKLSDGNYLFALRNTQAVHIYHVGNDLVLISALINAANDGITILPNKDAQEGLNAELAFFAGVADKL